MNNKQQTITIIGAGIAGCFLALLFAKRGYRVHIYEQHAQKDIIARSSKRSFNLTFYNYAVTALKEIGIWNKIKSILITLEGSVTYVTPGSSPSVVPFTMQDMHYYTVKRSSLLEAMIREAKHHPKITFHFQTALLTINRREKTMMIENVRTKTVKTVAAPVIFGADGVNSLVRSILQYGQATTHSQEYADWEYKQVTFPKKLSTTLGLRQNYQHAWTRRYAVAIAFPNGDGGFNALLALPKDASRGFAALQTSDDIKAFVAREFPDLLPALPEITDALLHYPLGNFVTINTDPWFYKDSLALIGDAAHGFLPFYGLGMSAAFGDCMELIRLVDKHGPEWETIFPLYQANRKKHTDVIAELSKGSLLRFTRYKKADYAAIYDRYQTMLHTIAPSVCPPPLFHLIASDPNKSADIMVQYNRFRTYASLFGFTALVATTTAVVGLAEHMYNRTKSPKNLHANS